MGSSGLKGDTIKGTVYGICSCLGPNGKALGTACADRHKRSHLSWGFRLNLPTGPGGRRNQPRQGGFSRKSDAERALREALTALDKGTYGARSKISTGDYLDGWLVGKAALRASTRRSYAGHIRLHLTPALGAVPLVDLRPAHVARMNAGLLAAGLSATSVRRVNATLRAALHDAVKADMIARNVAGLVDLPKQARAELHVWSAAELGAFLDFCEDTGERLRALYALAGLRGLRRGELVGLRWQDVDLDAGSLRVVQAVVAVGYELVIGEPKTRGSARTVSLDAGTVAALRAHKARQNAERLLWGELWQDSGRVFTREDGTGLHPEQVTRGFARLVKASGLPAVRLHDLRHGAASMAMAAGIPAKSISEQLGHSSIVVTMDLYAHASPGLQQDSAERTAALVPRRLRQT